MTPEMTALLGILAAFLGSVLGYIAAIRRNAAEADKLSAEAEKARAETEKIRRELELSSLSASTSPDESGTSAPCEITVLKPERTLLSDFYLEQAGSSSNIDIIALTLQSALENFSEAKFIQWIREGKHIRILMLSPSSSAAKMRSREEASDEDFLPNKILIQIKALKRLFTRAEKELKGHNYTGSLEVRLYDNLPYFSYFHTDKVMMMGLYYIHLPGLQSEALLIDEKSSIHAKMCSHFDAIWTSSGKRGAQKMTVCSIGRGRSQFNNGLLEGSQSTTQ